MNDFSAGFISASWRTRVLSARWRILTTLKGRPVRPFLLRMYNVCALYSLSHDKIYIGYTSDLMERIRSHNEFATKGYTIHYRPWELVYSEKHTLKSEALRRERQLKSAKGREFIRNIIKERF